MKKKILALLTATAVVLSGCGGAGGSGSSDTIKVGGIGPLTGKVAIYGVSATNGTKLAFEEINAKGGILGKKVEYILEDEKGDVNEAKNAYGKLVGENIDALIGDIISGPAYAIGEDAQRDGIPMITPTGTQLNITAGRSGVFRACFTDPYQGGILAKYVKENLKKTKIAVMKNTSSDYSAGVAEEFVKKAKELGLDVVEEVSYGDDDKDFKAQLSKIKQKDPEVLLIPDYYEKIALIAPQAREAGLKSQFVGPDGWDGVTKQFNGDKAALKTIEGAVFANHYSPSDKNEKIQNFVKNFKDKFKEDPTAFSALSYDAAYMLKEAIEKAGGTDKAKVLEALKAIEFSGVTGKLKFDENNNPIKSVTMLRVENGEYVFDSVVEN